MLGFSLLTGFLLAFRPQIPPQSRQYQVSQASSAILVGTRDSQVAAVGGRGPGLPTLAGRANLLGNLMTGGPLKEAIAKKAGVPSNLLTVVPPTNASTPGVAPVPVKPPASQGIPEAEATILSISTDETLPILHIVAQAPNAETARKLSGGTIVALRQYLASISASQHIPSARQLVVQQVGAPLAQTATRGLPRAVALAVTIILALLGCAAILGGSWFIRSWKQIGDAESRGQPPAEGVEHAVLIAGLPSSEHLTSGGPQAYPPESPQVFPPESPQAYPPESPQVFPPESPQAYPPESPQVFPPESPQAYPPEPAATLHSSKPLIRIRP